MTISSTSVCSRVESAKTRTARAIGLGLIGFILFLTCGCHKDVEPVSAFDSERVNAVATQLKKTCISILEDGLSSEDQRVRLKAALALASVNEPSGLDNAKSLMSGRQKEIALRAAYFFVRHDLALNPVVLSEAENMTRRGRGSLRDLAVAVLGSSIDPAHGQMVRQMWGDDKEKHLQVPAAAALARRSHSEAINWLNSNARRWLSYQGFDPFLFATIADDGARLDLVGALTVGEESSTVNALLAAETTKDSRAANVLQILYERKTGPNRVLAATVMAEMKNTGGIDVLKEAVGEGVPRIPEGIWAAMGLANLGDPSGLSGLLECLKSEQSDRRRLEIASRTLACLSAPTKAASALSECWLAEHM